MTYFTQERISSCEIAGAIADAAIHDCHINLFRFPGFPQIHVADPENDILKITLSWNLDTKNEVSFDLSCAEAIAAAKTFKAKKGVDMNIFDRVQSSIASLESKV